MTEANARIKINKLLEESDWILTGGKGVVSGAIGGAIAGSILGIPAQSLRFGFGTAAAGAVVCGMADIFDRSLMQKDARAKNKIHPNY